MALTTNTIDDTTSHFYFGTTVFIDPYVDISIGGVTFPANDLADTVVDFHRSQSQPDVNRFRINELELKIIDLESKLERVTKEFERWLQL